MSIFVALNICGRRAVVPGDAGRDSRWRWRCWSSSGSAPSRTWTSPLGAQYRPSRRRASCRKATARGSRSASGVLATLPFAVWLFLAIEQLPLAAEESVDPKRDMPQGHHPRHADADRLGLHDRVAQSVGHRRRRVQARDVGRAAARRLPGHLRQTAGGKCSALVAMIGLIASFHTIIYAQGRQIYSLSRAGYFPPALSITHGAARRRTWR